MELFQSEKLKSGQSSAVAIAFSAYRSDNEPTMDSDCEFVVIDDFRYKCATPETDIAL